MRKPAQYERLGGSFDEDEHVEPGRHVENEAAQPLTRDQFSLEDGALPFRHGSSRRTKFQRLIHGPDPPRPSVIKPFFPFLQEAPLRFMEINKHHFIKVYLLLGIVWFLCFTVFLYSQSPIKASDGRYVINLDCTDTFWKRKNGCGLDGIDCRPFTNQSFAFRCPAKCGDVKLLNPRVIGPDEYNYRPLVVGTDVYRGDSFICQSAIHAGIITDEGGGCGRVTLVGERDNFFASTRNGIESIPFKSYFPLSFALTTDADLQCSADLRSVFLPISLLSTAMLAVSSTSSKIFFPIFVLIFAHVSFISDPPTASYRNITVVPDHISMFAKRLLPALFVAVVIWMTVVKRTLTGLTAQFEKTLLWLGGFWIGALSNYTFDWIPISRLTAHDLEQQPGAKLALAIIILVLVLIVAGQMYSFWLEGRLPSYLLLYGLFIIGIILCLTIPGVNLRIHHYILALLFLPGTSLQTRPSLIYQGILLGLFVNGIARWDFDSVLQTSNALRADARSDSVVPNLLDPTIVRTAAGLSTTFIFGELPAGLDGISVLVNDVERDRVFDAEVEEAQLSFEWTRPPTQDFDEFFRFAYVRMDRTLDYSVPGTLFQNGSWLSAPRSEQTSAF